jgi:NADP-dependent aldehyde dehydrogenase
MNTDINSAVQAATLAAPSWGSSSAEDRAGLLEALAAGLEQKRQDLTTLADSQTHLGLARLGGELDRTCFQLRAFASYAREGGPFSRTDDAAVAGPPPAGRPQISRVRVPLGPIAMFSASNFPFAFSVLGGDTASALAAGCPVVVKAHPAHRLLSKAVHELAQAVLAGLGLPAGLIGHIEIDSHEAGLELVGHPAIEAVAFTGSLAGGQALQRQAQARLRPIPFYGELGSVNPVVVLPDALMQAGQEHARTLAASITQGAGQFCTSPGLLVMLDSPEARTLVEQLAREVERISLHAMLSERIRSSFESGVGALRQHAAVQVITADQPAATPCGGFIGLTTASEFIADERLRHEVFGAACLCVLADSLEQIGAVLHAVGGSLTVTMWGADADTEAHRQLLRAAQKMCGRVLFKGVPTGVAVTAAQHHGGPWPASTQPLYSSVGLAACDRFLRPLALQDAPDWLLRRAGVPV